APTTRRLCAVTPGIVIEVDPSSWTDWMTESAVVAVYVNTSPAPVALVCPPTVTRTSTEPLPAGLVALQLVVDEHDTPEPATPPKATVVAPGVVLNPDPVIVTPVPPPTGPDDGDTPLTDGADVYVNTSPAPVALVCPPTVTRTSTEPLPAGLVALQLVV